jgi:hypothetical protein
MSEHLRNYTGLEIHPPVYSRLPQGAVESYDYVRCRLRRCCQDMPPMHRTHWRPVGYSGFHIVRRLATQAKPANTERLYEVPD